MYQCLSNYTKHLFQTLSYRNSAYAKQLRHFNQQLHSHNRSDTTYNSNMYQCLNNYTKHLFQSLHPAYTTQQLGPTVGRMSGKDS